MTEFKRLSDRRGPGAGRPSKLYTKSSRLLSVTLPERRYDLAGQLLASAIDNATTDGTSVTAALNKVAADWGEAVGDHARTTAGPRPGHERLVASTCRALSEHEYEPQRDGDAIMLSNCPFDTLAREHTQLVCGMNLAIMDALTDRVGQNVLAARFTPAPDRCCVVLDVGAAAVRRRSPSASSTPTSLDEPW